MLVTETSFTGEVSWICRSVFQYKEGKKQVDSHNYKRKKGRGTLPVNFALSFGGGGQVHVGRVGPSQVL